MIPTIIEDWVPEGTVFLVPPITATVYLPIGQQEPTFRQKMDALIEAYTQSAKRGEIGVIKSLKGE